MAKSVAMSPRVISDRLVVASAQANPTVGDIDGNAAKARELMARATALGADIALFPELFLIGYPPEDLALKPAAVRACKRALERLAKETAGGSAGRRFVRGELGGLFNRTDSRRRSSPAPVGGRTGPTGRRSGDRAPAAA